MKKPRSRPSQPPNRHPNRQLLAQLWQKNLPTLRERLDLLDRSASTAASGTLAEPPVSKPSTSLTSSPARSACTATSKAPRSPAKMERILKSPTPETLVTLRALAADLRKSLASNL